MSVEMEPDTTSDKINPNDIVEAIEDMRVTYPANRMARFFPTEYFLRLPSDKQKQVVAIVRAGLENDDSEIGAYAMHTTDYDEFAPVLDPIIRDYHAIDKNFTFQEDWNIKGKNLDLRNIDPKLANVSMRVRVARNAEGFPLTGSMIQKDRVAFEDYIVTKVFEKMIADPNYGGEYVSLTPGSRYEISMVAYEQLVADHKMFKDMSADPHLAAAGISGDWPYGRGAYISGDGKSIVWVNEEDHLRIMNMERGSDLFKIFNGLKQKLDLVEKLGVSFAKSEKYGYVTTCPSNLGTGMRASLHLALPELTEFGENVDKLKGILKANSLNVSVRGMGGEHTAAGKDGKVDISPRGRMISESLVITQLYEAAAKLLALETSTQA